MVQELDVCFLLKQSFGLIVFASYSIDLTVEHFLIVPFSVVVSIFLALVWSAYLVAKLWFICLLFYFPVFCMLNCLSRVCFFFTYIDGLFGKDGSLLGCPKTFQVGYKQTSFLLCSGKDLEYRDFLVAHLVKKPPVMQETRVWFPGWEDALEKG